MGRAGASRRHLVGRPQFAHSRTLLEFWGLSTAVRDDLQVSTHKSKACLTGGFGTSCIVTWIFTQTNFKLCFLGVIGARRYTYNFFAICRKYWLKIQTCRTNFWWAMSHNFICLAQLTSPDSPLWFRLYCLVRCLVQRRNRTLLIWGWRRTGHHSHIATLQTDDHWISSPKASIKP